MWAEDTVDDTYIRRSLKTKSWEKAVTKACEIEASEAPTPPPPKEEPIPVEEAVREYLADARARELRDSTLYKLKLIFETQLLEWCKKASTLVSAISISARCRRSARAGVMVHWRKRRSRNG